MIISDASQRQNTAANPVSNTWLSANAGSGKTRVLTDRVARLLLHGADPRKILCLTYTKAAAAEMQNRLFKRLGEWAMMGNAELKQSLRELGEDGLLEPDMARTLFARAIETPGGLKIQTIHAFCAALLRQFPVEAGVSPLFKELDDAGRDQIIQRVLDQMADGDDAGLTMIAPYVNVDSLAKIAISVAGDADSFAKTDGVSAYSAFDTSPDITLSDIIQRVVSDADIALLKSLIQLLLASDKTTDHSTAAVFASLPDTIDEPAFDTLVNLFLTGDGAQAPFTAKFNAAPTKKTQEAMDTGQLDQLNALKQRVEDGRREVIALKAAQRTQALWTFARVFLPAYVAEKERLGVLDFDDLIRKARDLLDDRTMQWVLYRLDGGIDHILVDEAQDTSPAQWDVITKLSDEITSGQGANENVSRTIFVVGDKKQSIYSFQGADARQFDVMSDRYQTALQHGSKLQQLELEHSFRSSSAVLSAVDHVFAGDTSQGLGGPPKHIAFHENLPGRVDVWDLVPRNDAMEEHDWFDPVDRVLPEDPPVVLAERIASFIKELLKTGTLPADNKDPTAFRPVTPGDIKILVQRRSDLFHQIISACKAAELPIAGADRLKVQSELAVRDLLALLAFLDLPEDDLSLAATLKSPLFGWSETDLFKLAYGRKGHLWQALRDARDDHASELAILDDMRRYSEFERPFELLERILNLHGGRKRLIARLGSEAEDGIDELLNQALAYEQTAVPSLSGFLAQTDASDTDVKREADASGDLIQVLTVHGAKGLESPIIIAPDTIRARRPGGGSSYVKTPDGLPIWAMSQAESPPLSLSARDALEAAELEEGQRLLYVAMTRAEHWLIVAGADQKSKTANWHEPIQSSLNEMGGQRLSTGDINFIRYQHGNWSKTATLAAKASKPPPALDDLPTLKQPAPAPVRPPTVYAPSDLGGAKIMPGDGGGLSADMAMARGNVIHRLLELINETDPATHGSLAENLIKATPGLADVASPSDLLDEARATIAAAPDLFRSDAMAEVALTAPWHDRAARLNGAVDRLLITDQAIHIADIKTNTVVPEHEQDVPDGILRQMGAYLIAAEQIWPNTPIVLEILWTHTARRMVLTHGIVRNALSDATTS